MSFDAKVRRICKAFAILAIAGVLAIAALLGALWLEHRTEVELPVPTGRFAVGRVVYDWADPTRELLVWIWYPSAAGQSNAVNDYLPPPLRAEIERARGPFISKFLTRDLSKVRSHSVRNAAVSAQQRSYPVVIMRAGASAEVWNYSTLAEDLASHGYVVVGFDAAYRTGLVVFPDGRVIRRAPKNDLERWSAQERQSRASALLGAWTADASFVLDRLERLNTADASGKFTGRLDMTRVGIFGHSFGGAVAAQFCHEDSRCRAGIDVDGALQGSVIQAGIDRSFMFLLSDHSGESDPESSRILANIQSVYDRLPANGRRRVVIRGANHFTFSDDGAVLKSHLFRGVLRLFGKLRISGRRQLEITAYHVHAFFDAYLMP